jgi:hypothetical protein
MLPVGVLDWDEEGGAEEFVQRKKVLRGSGEMPVGVLEAEFESDERKMPEPDGSEASRFDSYWPKLYKWRAASWHPCDTVDGETDRQEPKERGVDGEKNLQEPKQWDVVSSHPSADTDLDGEVDWEAIDKWNVVPCNDTSAKVNSEENWEEVKERDIVPLEDLEGMRIFEAPYKSEAGEEKDGEELGKWDDVFRADVEGMRIVEVPYKAEE